jgi:hypothetical protein
MKLDHPAGEGYSELNVQVRQVWAKLGSVQRHDVVAFVFDFAVVTPGKGPGVPDAGSELLTKVNVAEPDILGLQAA